MLPIISIRKFAFRHSFVPSTHRILREGSSSKSKMCVSLQRRAIPHFKIHVLLQRRAPKCMNPAHDVRGDPRHAKISILPQFRTSDQHEVTRGFRTKLHKFAFHHSFGRPMSTKRREGCERTQADSHFTSVLDVRRARNDERVATTTYKIRISPQFWTSDEHEVTRGLRGDLKNSHFTTVLDVRRARSDERVVSRLDRPNPPCVKKERNFKEVLIHNHSQQIFSADFFSRSSQQIFSADLLSRSSQQIFFSRSSQQIFSADLLSRSSQQIFSADFLQQIFSADLLSRSSQQIFSADLLSRSSQQIFFSRSSQHIFFSRSSQQIFSADFLSRSSQQIFSADLLSRFSQQIFSADLLSRSSHCLIICCGQGLVVSYCLIILIICCGQGLVVSYCLIICCGQGLVVSYCLIMLVVYTA